MISHGSTAWLGLCWENLASVAYLRAVYPVGLGNDLYDLEYSLIKHVLSD